MDEDKALPGTAGEHTIDTEVMRIVAAFFVVMIHVSGLDSLPAIFFRSIACFSVPTFVIISGYHMLAHGRSGRSIAQKCGGMFLLMVVWSAIYYGYELLCSVRSYGGLSDALSYLLAGPVHLWYLYAAIALYAFTPVLYVFHRAAAKREYLYALIVTFSLGSVVLLLLRAGWPAILPEIVERMKAPYTLGFVSLYLFGGYLRKFGIESRTHRRALYLVGAAGVAATVAGTAVLSPEGLLLSFFAPNVIVTGAAFFVLVQDTCRTARTVPGRLRTAVHQLAACTLGIYLIHPLILSILQRGAPGLFSDMPGAAIVPRSVLVYLLSLAVVAAAERLPVVNKIFYPPPPRVRPGTNQERPARASPRWPFLVPAYGPGLCPVGRGHHRTRTAVP